MSGLGGRLSIVREPGDDSDELATAGLDSHQLELAQKAGLQPQEYAAEIDAILAELEGASKKERSPVQYGTAINEQPPAIPWLIEGIMPAASLSIIAAEGGVGKSTLIAQMCLVMAAGKEEFFGFKIPKAVRCLYLQAEGARHVFLGRLNVAGYHLGVNHLAETLPLYVQPAGDWVKDTGAELERMVSEVKAQFCVIDTQGLFHAGDENSNTEIKLHLIKPLQAIAARTGCAFMVIHHLSKPGKDRPAGRHQIRGASAFVDDTDLSMLLEAPDGIKKPRRNLVFTKNRNGPHPEDIGLEYVSEEARFRLFDSAEAEAAAKEAEAARRKKHTDELMNKMLEIIKGSPNLSGEEIYERMGPARKADLAAAKAALLNGKLIFSEQGAGRTQRYYAATRV